MRSNILLVLFVVTVAGLTLVLEAGRTDVNAAATTVTVCSSGCDHPDIQPAINAAAAGDTVLVAPGTYSGPLAVARPITLASHFHTSGDTNAVTTTTIDSGSPILSFSSAAAGAKVIGFTFTGGTKGVVSFADDIEVLDNRFVDVGSDSVSFEQSGGVVRRNHFLNAGDDGIDLDGPTGGHYEDNTFQGSGDDGIEVRLFDYQGAMRDLHIQRNTISASEEDAIQLIDYSGISDYTIHIARNLLLGSVDAGIGIMDGGRTVEDFRGASIPERVNVLHNTFAGNGYGLTGGDALAAVGNIFVDQRTLAMKNVDGDSVTAYNLFWSNAVDYTSSNVDAATTVFADPMLSAAYEPREGSPAIDAGTASFSFREQPVLSMPSGEYTGAAPDIGRYEYGLMPSPSVTPTTR